jgi:mono/diheme cytochrome c family protein
MRKAIVPVIIAIVVAVIAWGYWFLTAHGFSAREPPSALETLLATNLRRLATPREAKHLRNPFPQTPENVAEARHHFADHCAICHGNDGSGKTQIGSGLYPPPPDLRQARTQNLGDGEIFYIIKNGVRFTGMPGWGGEDEENEENWKLVVFIRHLPHLTAEELESMRKINRLEEEGKAHHHH